MQQNISDWNCLLELFQAVKELAAAFPPILPVNTITSITIIFDEGTDTGPDNFGLAVLDNVDVNATLVGKGPGS